MATLSEVLFVPPPMVQVPVPIALGLAAMVTLPSLMFNPPDQLVFCRTKRTSPKPVLLIVPTPETVVSN